MATLNTLDNVPDGLISLLKERFWKRVQKTASCWLWSGSYCAGYGIFGLTYNGERYTFVAHKVGWLLHHEDIPENICVLHDCQRHNGLGDVRGCVNPDHLKLGTRGDNSRDWRIKGPSPIPRLTTVEANRLWPKPISDWERRFRERERRWLAKEQRCVVDDVLASTKQCRSGLLVAGQSDP